MNIPTPARVTAKPLPFTNNAPAPKPQPAPQPKAPKATAPKATPAPRPTKATAPRLCTCGKEYYGTEQEAMDRAASIAWQQRKLDKVVFYPCPRSRSTHWTRSTGGRNSHRAMYLKGASPTLKRLR